MTDLLVTDPATGEPVGALPVSDAEIAVVTGVCPGMALVEEETFGPVAAVQVVGSFDEALHLADGTVDGLAAVVLHGSWNLLATLLALGHSDLLG